jgi:hypothetical protein
MQEILTAKILAKLYNRKGFDRFWDGLDTEIKVEIAIAIAEIIRDTLAGNTELTELEQLFTVDRIREE